MLSVKFKDKVYGNKSQQTFVANCNKFASLLSIAKNFQRNKYFVTDVK